MLSADDVITRLALEPLPHEGGSFLETYRSPQRVACPESTDGADRAASTQIYYLLRRGESSSLHRVRSDEVFHHYLGDPVIQLRIDDGTKTFGEAGDIKLTADAAETVTIGPDLAADQRPQVLAPRHVWQGAVLGEGPAGYALLGCTVAPGFEWADFELITPGYAERLAGDLSDRADLIHAMTPAPGRTRA